MDRDKEDKTSYNEERLRDFHRSVVDVVLQYMLDPKVSGGEERHARLTDIGYGLCLVLALHIKLLARMQQDEACEERLIKLVNTILIEALANKNILIGFPKELIEKYSLHPVSPTHGYMKAEVTKEEIEKHPPKPIIELATWMAKEVHKTLLKEGFDVEELPVGEIHFSKDNFGKMKEIVLRVKFIRKEDGNEGQSS